MNHKRRPFAHQQEAFDIVARQRKSLYMIAGTAAGKTLAISLPLFHLLQQGEIRRVVFMYPTLALLDDQRRVMEKLAKITQLKVAEIKGGMKRSELITALNSHVILATPDAIYWFFRKEVKFSSLLIYGLARVDAFVLDEAHLFNGLSLRNLTLLKERILALAKQLDRQPQWHILTATPHDDLRALTTDGVEIYGKSKCGPVGLDLLEPQENIADGRSRMVAMVNQVLEQGVKKVLLVFNSAAAAHDTFLACRNNRPEIPAKLMRKYGRVWPSDLQKWMEEEGIDEVAVKEVKKAVTPYHHVPLHELDKNGVVRLNSADVMVVIATLLDAQVKTVVNNLQSGEGKIVDKFARQLQKIVLTSDVNPTEAKDRLEQWLTERTVRLEEIWNDAEITITTPDALELSDDLDEAGFPTSLSGEIHRRLLHGIHVSQHQVNQWGHVPKSVRSQRIMLSGAGKQISSLEERSYFQEMLDEPAAFARLAVDLPNVGLWINSDVPVVLYSGKMAKDEREGQIQLFDELERAVLVSTSAVEVGVDFDADVLITEQCPGPDLLQRFGRIGRREMIQGRVVLQVHDHHAYFQMQQQLQTSTTLSREMFSEIVTALFPPRRYLSGSVFLDATHWLINDQIGYIGKMINEAIFMQEVVQLAEQIRQADLPFAFGLRSTMSQVSLRNGVTLSPFYALRKISNEQLWPDYSPFVLTQADIPYNRFIFQSAEWNIIVDWQRTLKDSLALFYRMLNKQWQIRIGTGIAQIYRQSLSKRMRILALLEHQPEQYQQLLEEQPQHPLTRLGSAIQQLQTEKHGLILGYGNVYLKREHREGFTYPMEDAFGTPLHLPNQVWLFIIGDVLDVKKQLETLNFNDVEELVSIDCDNQGVMLVEAMVGATFQVYQEWNTALDSKRMM